MEERIKIIDKSNDRKYFTVIPNYIVNHSTFLEQALYLKMKRIAGERNSCWTSPKNLMKGSGVCCHTIRKTQQKLLERKWIILLGMKGKTKPTPEYKIVDLWEKNNSFYFSKKKGEMTPNLKRLGVDSPKKGEMTPIERGNDTTEEEHSKKITKEDTIVSTKLAEQSSANLNKFINLFQTINPSYQRLFANKTQRAALNRLLKVHGEEKVKWLLSVLPEIAAKKYAPIITTPLQLEEKLAQVLIFLKRKEISGIAKIS